MTADWQAAIDAGDVERPQALLDQGADIDALDRYGQSGLMLAAMYGRTAVVDVLVAHGATLDHTAKFNLSALMLAVINGHVEIVRALVQAGAATELRGSGAPGFHHKKAIDLAATPGHADVLNILRAVPQRRPQPADNV